MLLPFMGETEAWGFAVHNLQLSAHPDARPRASLALVARLVSLQGPLFTNDLRAVLDRIVAAEPEVRHDAVFRSLDVSLRAAGR